MGAAENASLGQSVKLLSDQLRDHPSEGKLSDAEAEVKLLASFRRHDANGDGCISAEEFQDLIRRLDPSFAEDDLQPLFKAADANRDGFLDVQEFLRWLITPQADAAAAEARVRARFLTETNLMRSCSGSWHELEEIEAAGLGPPPCCE